jgi:7-cyano-7-deazaguanine synthase
MTKSIVLCSGGLNSAVLVAIAREAGPLTLIHARFERPAASREAELAARLAGHYKISDALVLDLPHVAALRAQSAANADVAATPAPSNISADAPIPGLLTTLVGVAATAAAAVGATRIWFGLSEPPTLAADAAHPDPAQACEFAQLMECAIALNSQPPMTLETPLIDMTRGDIVALARRMEVPLKLTWSCWTSGDTPCQTCPGCRSRARGFLDATTPDPIIARPASPTPATQPAAI